MLPLAGKRILITRARPQIAEVASEVRRRGGVPVAFPCLEVHCRTRAIKNAAAWLAAGDVQVLFTSARGVECVLRTLEEEALAALRRLPVVAVGARTAQCLRNFGIVPAWLPNHASQEGLLAAWRSRGLPRRLVFFRAEEGRDLLPQAMSAAGVEVHLVPAYRVRCPREDAGDVLRALRSGEIDAVLLGSAKTVQHYVQRVGDARLASRPVIAVISRQVEAAALALNLDVQIVAKEVSFSAMLDALADWFRRHKA